MTKFAMLSEADIASFSTRNDRKVVGSGLSAFGCRHGKSGHIHLARSGQKNGTVVLCARTRKGSVRTLVVNDTYLKNPTSLAQSINVTFSSWQLNRPFPVRSIAFTPLCFSIQDGSEAYTASISATLRGSFIKSVLIRFIV